MLETLWRVRVCAGEAGSVSKMASSGSARNTPRPNSPTAAPVNFKANQQKRLKTESLMVDFFLKCNFQEGTLLSETARAARSVTFRGSVLKRDCSAFDVGRITTQRQRHLTPAAAAGLLPLLCNVDAQLTLWTDSSTLLSQQ